jgi:hypothetical protein
MKKGTKVKVKFKAIVKYLAADEVQVAIPYRAAPEGEDYGNDSDWWATFPIFIIPSNQSLIVNETAKVKFEGVVSRAASEKGEVVLWVVGEDNNLVEVCVPKFVVKKS